jgi:hypothetical protein
MGFPNRDGLAYRVDVFRSGKKPIGHKAGCVGITADAGPFRPHGFIRSEDGIVFGGNAGLSGPHRRFSINRLGRAVLWNACYVTDVVLSTKFFA